MGILIYVIISILFFLCHIINHNAYSNHIIFGMLSRLSTRMSKYFFLSLKKIKFKGKIIIFIDKKENSYICKNLDINYLYFNYSFPYYPINNNKYHVEISFIRNTYPELHKIKDHNTFIWILRYYLIYTFIKFHGHYNTIYLLSDIRDVIFQSDPFAWRYKKGVYLVEESKIRSLKESCINFMKIYTIDENILKNRILNGGIIFGSGKEMKLFLNEYLYLYKKDGKNGVDQAFLNYFYYSRSFFNYPIRICESNKCFAKCIIQEINFTYSNIINKTDMMIYNQDGTLPSLIHQYTFAYSRPPFSRKKLFEKYRYERTK